jgi:UDP-N-acetylmuramyl pentapeptide phosphotransferase/UDP-N-acetylglucosamine-1-phosphate transferase/glycosyltransferase involved in cell wall biosynthesis
MTKEWTYAVGAVGAFAASLILTPIFISVATQFGVVDLPNARKVHDRPIPRSGGLAMALSCVLVLVLMFAFDPVLNESIVGQHITLLTLLTTTVIVLALGVADDMLDVPSKYKLVVLTLVAFLFTGSGQQITRLQLGPWGVDLGLLAWPVTMVWLIALPVSLNFVDGLDGLAGGISALAAMVVGIIAMASGALHVALIAWTIVGCLAGFLVFNFNPAKVFMGDAGSMFLGFSIAALAVMAEGTTNQWNVVPAVMVAFSIPFLDTMFTFVRRRVLLRRSLFSAERGHIHHRLLDLGLHQKHAVLLLYGATAFSAATALVLFFSHQRRVEAVALGAQACMLIGLFRSAGSARARETVSALRRNRRIGKDTRRYRSAFEELQTRFRLTKNFEEWWQEVCAAGEMLDFLRLELPVTGRNNSLRQMSWANKKEFPSQETVSVVVPIAHRRPGNALRANVEIATGGLLESAGERIAIFTRLMSEFSVAALPDPDVAPAKFSLMSALRFVPAKGNGTKARLRLQKYEDENPYVEEKPISELKVAIVHDFLYTYGGAERVLEQMIEVLPQAELFSLFDFLPKDGRGFIKNKPVTTSFLQKMPFARKRHRAYLPLMPLAVEQLDVSKFDLVISSSYVAAKGVLTRPDQLHICYCHSPIRFAWDLQHQYLGEAGLVKGLKSWFARAILHYTRMWDVRSSVGVDVFLSNSLFVGRRIEKVYRRSSTPLYPPVDVQRFTPTGNKEEFYLTASRMVPYKRTALIVEAFNRMPERKLMVVGEGPEFEAIREMAGPNVKVLGHQPFDRLRTLMQHAKAFVFAAEEDFGIVAVEAQACGTPVIAFGRGGATETVLHGKTGMFFAEQTPESLMSAVMAFEERGPWDSEAIRRNAEAFSTDMFKAKLLDIVESEWHAFIERRKRNLALSHDQHGKFAFAPDVSGHSPLDGTGAPDSVKAG